MIDHHARSKLAEAARALIAGHITNDQFEDRQPSSSDPAVQEIFYRGFWPLYSDTHAHHLIGKYRLAARDRESAARCILFLKSGLPYGWPVLSVFGRITLFLRNIVTFGRADRAYRQHLSSHGDVSMWPFQSAAQYTEALRSPAYLTGLGANNSFKPNLLRSTNNMAD